MKFFHRNLKGIAASIKTTISGKCTQFSSVRIAVIVVYHMNCHVTLQLCKTQEILPCQHTMWHENWGNKCVMDTTHKAEIFTPTYLVVLTLTHCCENIKSYLVHYMERWEASKFKHLNAVCWHMQD